MQKRRTRKTASRKKDSIISRDVYEGGNYNAGRPNPEESKLNEQVQIDHENQNESKTNPGPSEP